MWNYTSLRVGTGHLNEQSQLEFNLPALIQGAEL